MRITKETWKKRIVLCDECVVKRAEDRFAQRFVVVGVPNSCGSALFCYAFVLLLLLLSRCVPHSLQYQLTIVLFRLFLAHYVRSPRAVWYTSARREWSQRADDIVVVIVNDA